TTTTSTSTTTTTSTSTSTTTSTSATTATTTTSTSATTATTTTATTATTTTATTSTSTSTTTPSPACAAISFANGDFESGTSAGWTVGGGSRNGDITDNIYPDDYLPGGSHYSLTIANTHSSIVTHGYDPVLGTLMPNIVFRGSYSWRVEDTVNGGYGSVLSQAVHNYSCTDIYFAWLAALENGGHTAAQSSVMIIEVKDLTVGDVILRRVYNAGGSGGVDSRFNQSGSYFYTPSWEIEHLVINSTRIGNSFTLSALAIDCSQLGHSGRIYLDSFGGVPL
ncbi:unnamed protein product, partial [Adineta steineri]